MLKDYVVLGAGSAGLLAAMTIRRKFPGATVRIVRSRELGVIGVGESTTPNLPRFLFDYLGVKRKMFYAVAEPTWKLGIRFLWGPRKSYDYSFEPQLDGQWDDLPRPNGFYCDEEFDDVNMASALMRRDKIFLRQPDGSPLIEGNHAFHLFNPKFVDALEQLAGSLGCEFIDGNVAGATRSGDGIASIQLEDGRSLAADFFVDASGFRSELLGKALGESFEPYANSLFNDRAIVGSWDRTDEPILPYTIAETMDSGWAWMIDHETRTNRGYVYSSNFISDDDAHAEFAKKNPKAKIVDRVIKFKTGRYRRGWVGNVMAVGNSCGFVEPLEATALLIVCWQLQTWADMMLQSGCNPPPSMRDLFNRHWQDMWDDVRNFLTLHFIANKRIDSPYWRAANHDSDASALAGLMQFYEANGPSGFLRYSLGPTGSQFGVEGYLVTLIGNKVAHRATYVPSAAERASWDAKRQSFARRADGAMDAKEAMTYVKHPDWNWSGDGK